MYTSRIVGAGKFKGDPLVFFVLSSKSIPFRELRINTDKKRIYVHPKKGFESHPTNQDPEVDNYSCITTGENKLKDKWAVAFNGHMSKRTNNNLQAMNPFTALDLTLLDFRGMKNDARIGAIAYSIECNKECSLWLGMNDIEKPEKRICSYPNYRIKNIEDQLIFIYDKNTNLESCFEIKTQERSSEGLAQYIHENLIGQEILFGVATGVAIIRRDKFDLGIYNLPFNEDKIAEWDKKYKEK